MSQIKLHEFLPPEKFPDYFDSFSKLESVVQHLDGMYLNLIKEIFAHQDYENRMEKQLVKDRKDLKNLRAKLPAFEKYLKTFKERSSDKRDELNMEDRLYKVKRRISMLEDRMNEKMTGRRVMNQLMLAQKKATVEALEEWMEQLGAWFETGVLGKGEVVFNGKKIKSRT